MANKSSIVVFLGGVLIGTIFISIYVATSSSVGSFQPSGSLWGHNAEFKGNNVTEIDAYYRGPANATLAAELYSKVRIFCWVLTNPSTVQEKAVPIWKTWAKRCNKIVFMTSQATDLVPVVVLPVQEGRDHLTSKSVQAFNYTFHNYWNDYDWFLKADDDTFVVVENMRYFLQKFSPDDPVFFGYHFKPYLKQGYYSGGAGYVLSKEALRRFVKDGLDQNRCARDGGAEDLEIGKCLESVGVKTGDSRDYLGRERFHPFTVDTHLEGNYPDWYYQYAYHGAQKGLACCSDLSITFHYVGPREMYLMDYMIYHLRPYGIGEPSTINLNASPPAQGEMRSLNESSDSLLS